MNISVIHARRLGDIEDMLCAVRNLNEAAFMAATTLRDDTAANAIQSVLNEIDNKLLVAADRLKELREELK